MATRAKQQPIESEYIDITDTPALTTAPLIQEDYDDVTALNKVLAELGADEEGGGFVVVHREVTDNSGKRNDEYLDRYPANDFSMEALKARWGAGKYKILVYHTSNGQTGLATRKVITIAKSPANETGMTATAPAAVDLAPILQTMQQGFTAMVEAMRQQQPQQQSRADMLQEMVMYKELFAHPQPAQQPTNTLDILKLGIEMAQSGMGGQSDNAWVNKVIDQLAPILMPPIAAAISGATTPHAQHQHAPQVPQAAPQLAPPPPAAAKPAVHLNPQQLQEDDPVKIIVVQYLNMLTKAAAKNAPVDEYADSILATVPPSNLAELEAMLRPATWREDLKKYTEAIEVYPAWFTQLRDTVLQFIDDDKAAALGLTEPENMGNVMQHENADTRISTENPH